jgi:hypothetical protein
VDDLRLLLLPAFIHVLMVFVTVSRMGYGRVIAVRAGKVRPKDVVLDNQRWPDDLRKLGNNYASQFELPVLYYAALTLLIATGLVDGVAVVLSWAFVATRLVHNAIHTGINHLLYRFFAFLSGVGILGLMWAWFALRFFVIG